MKKVYIVLIATIFLFLFLNLPISHAQDDAVKIAGQLNKWVVRLYQLGKYSEAINDAREVLAFCEKTLGPNHTRVAESLNNLALLYYSLGDYARAEPLYKRSLAILEKALGPDHSDVAQSLNNLAALYYSSGEYGKAKPLLKRSLAIRENALGPDHPDVAESLSNLAVLYYSSGDYGKTEPLYKRALAILEKALGPDHPIVAASLNNLAELYAALDNFAKAHDLLKKSQMIDSKLIDQVMGFASEDQKIEFLSKKKWPLYAFLSLVNQHPGQNSSHRKDALDVWLKRKGVILEAQKRLQEALIYSDDPEAISTFQELARVRSQLSKHAFAGPGKGGAEAYQKKKADLEAQKEILESRLSQLSQSFALNQKIAKADSEKVSRALPENTILLEFARVDKFNFKTRDWKRRWEPARYLAFILHAGKSDKIGMIDLGVADQVDKVLARLKREIVGLKDLKGMKTIDSSRKLYDLVFKPIKKGLGSVKEIYISPDGNLNLIPFEMLQGPDGRFLIEDYTFNYLTAGRDIIGFKEIKEKGGKALLMGDPDFDMGAKEKDTTLRKLTLSKIKHKETVTRSMDMRGFYFGRLPGTRDEVKFIQKLFGKDKAECFTANEALEEILRQKSAPKILHLATHGFFFKDLNLTNLRNDGMDRGVMGIKELYRPIGKKSIIENPLLRSGIALAGANSSLQSGDKGTNDGIVTAEKILGLKLRGTDVVVLSACKTGMGEVKSGEGVYGLRRAFTQAGAKSLVMSMWSVPDRETKELMIQFYKNMLSGNMTRAQALRQAALRQMNTVKEHYGHVNPFYWGAFVFMGEP